MVAMDLSDHLKMRWAYDIDSKKKLKDQNTLILISTISLFKSICPSHYNMIQQIHISHSTLNNLSYMHQPRSFAPN